MAEDDRAGALAEAYKRNILPPDMKSAYEEAQKRGLVAGGQATKSEQQPSMLGDVVASFGRGVAKGAIGLAGLPGDVSNLVGAGIEKGGEFLGAAPREVPQLSGLPTSGDITGKVEEVAGKFEEPKTTAGKFSQSVGEFVPSAFVGPGGLATKSATTVAGGLAAEAGGELGGEWGRFLGGLVGSGTGVVGAEANAKRLAGRLPTLEQIKDSAQSAFKWVEDPANRLIIKKEANDNFVSALRAELDQRLFDQQSAGRSLKAVEQIAASQGDIKGMVDIRQALGKIKPSEGADFEAAQHIKDAIDHFVDNVPAADVISGNPQATQDILNVARSSWRAYAKLDQVQTALEIGEHTAAVSGTGANTENAMRQRIRQILDSEKNSRGFTPETRKQMEDIVTGTWIRNGARFAGKFAPSGPVSLTSTLAAGAGAMAIGEPTLPIMAAVAIPTTIAKYLGTYLTKRQILKLEDMIKAEAPIGRPIAAQNATQTQSLGAAAGAGVLRSGMGALAAGADSPLAQPGN